MRRAQAINRAIAFLRQASWRLCLLIVLLSVAVGGPAACVIHCLRHHAPPPVVQALVASHDSHHAAHGGMSHAERSMPDDSRYPTTSDEPTALTIAVVLPLLLLPLLVVQSLMQPPGLAPLRDVWLLPPRDPPRALLAHS